MIWFLDFEASGLGPESYPIQVGWCDENGVGEELLIRPEPSWTDWDYNAQAIHGLTQGDLEIKGRPAAEVARRVVEVLGGQRIHSDAPGFDAAWLDVLLSAGDYPSDAVRLVDVGQAYAESCCPLMIGMPSPGMNDYELQKWRRSQQAIRIMADAGSEEEARGPRRHRALEDAKSLQRTWASVRRRVSEAIKG